MRRPRARAVGTGLLTGLLGLAAIAASSTAVAQVRQPGETLSAGESSGPLSDVSRPLGDDRRSVHDGAQTIGETGGGPVHSRPVRDAGSRAMLSGPVSEVSQGPMYEPRRPLTSGAVAEASAGAVKHDIDSPLGERISSPLRELGPLQRAMRARREQAEQAALEGATEPAAPAIEAPAAAEEPAGAPAVEQLPPGADDEAVERPPAAAGEPPAVAEAPPGAPEEPPPADAEEPPAE